MRNVVGGFSSSGTAKAEAGRSNIRRAVSKPRETENVEAAGFTRPLA